MPSNGWESSKWPWTMIFRMFPMTATFPLSIMCALWLMQFKLPKVSNAFALWCHSFSFQHYLMSSMLYICGKRDYEQETVIWPYATIFWLWPLVVIFRWLQWDDQNNNPNPFTAVSSSHNVNKTPQQFENSTNSIRWTKITFKYQTLTSAIWG